MQPAIFRYTSGGGHGRRWLDGRRQARHFQTIKTAQDIEALNTADAETRM